MWTSVIFLFFSPQQQIVQYLKDMFDHDKVRFSSAQSLAEDILKLSHRRSEILLGYLGIDSLVEVNGTLPQDTRGSLEPHWDNLKVTKVFNGVASNTGGLNSRQLKD